MNELITSLPQQPVQRRALLKGIGIAGAGLLAGGLLAGCGGSSDSSSTASTLDTQILSAAKIAEALAVTLYTGIINESTFFAGLADDDKDYFRAARDEEKYHYDLLKSATGGTDAPTTYYFPAGTFANTATTLTVLITLEEAFIAAYLVGVKLLSSSSLRVLAAQIMGIESDHRTLARIIADEQGLATVTGLSGTAESTTPPNNNVYERTYGLSTLDQVVNALKPFFDAATATTAGYSVSRTFNPAYAPTFSGLKGNPPA